MRETDPSEGCDRHGVSWQRSQPIANRFGQRCYALVDGAVAALHVRGRLQAASSRSRGVSTPTPVVLAAAGASTAAR